MFIPWFHQGLNSQQPHGVEKLWFKFRDLRMDRSGDMNFLLLLSQADQFPDFSICMDIYN